MNSRRNIQSTGKKIVVRNSTADKDASLALKGTKPEIHETEAETNFLDDEMEIDNAEDIAKYLKKSKAGDESEVPKKNDKQTRRKKAAKIRHTKIKRGLIVSLCFIFIFATLGALAFFLLLPKTEEAKSTRAEAPQPESDKIYYSTLTGLEVENPETATAATTCIMIENSPDARPQSGLDQAGLVFEANAEGGITRFMAIFQEAKPQFIGPVRSLRMTYAEMAKPFHCSIAHVGGADNALRLVHNNSEFRDIDQFFNDPYYWREKRAIAGKRRYAPHNVYTSFTKLDELNNRKGFNTSTFGGLPRVNPDQPPAEVEQNATNVNIKMSSDTYNPVFTYNPETNSYLRSHKSGGPHMSIYEDGHQVQISPTVVIAAKVEAYRRPGPDGFSDYTTIGENEAYIFQNGTVTVGKWRREDANAELKFYDRDENIIKLNRGQVWISLYPSNSGNVNWN